MSGPFLEQPSNLASAYRVDKTPSYITCNLHHRLDLPKRWKITSFLVSIPWKWKIISFQSDPADGNIPSIGKSILVSLWDHTLEKFSYSHKWMKLMSSFHLKYDSCCSIWFSAGDLLRTNHITKHMIAVAAQPDDLSDIDIWISMSIIYISIPQWPRYIVQQCATW